MSRRRPPPLLPKADLLAAINRPTPAQRRYPLAVFNPHIHLWATPRILDKLDWLIAGLADRDKAAAVHTDHDAQRYLSGVQVLVDKGKTKFDGGVYVQVEVRHAEGQWEHAIDEISWLCDAELPRMPPLHIVPWAPLTEGPAAMQAYHDKLTASMMQSSRPLIRGYRFLFRNLVTGDFIPILQDSVVDSLVWLGQQGLTFDINVDAKAQGPAVLGEVLECISRVYAKQQDGLNTRFVLDHLGVPDLSSVMDRPNRPFLEEYEQRMSELSLLPTVYIKYSGFLSQLPAKTVQEAFAGYIAKGDAAQHPNRAYSDCKKALSAFVTPLLEAFGEERIMWAGDWPVSKMNVLGKDAPEEEHVRLWEFSYRMALEVLVELGLPDEALDKIFCTNAKAFYGIEQDKTS